MVKPVSTLFRLILVLLLFAALFSYAMFQGGFVSWFLFFSYLPILVYSILMFFYPINLTEINRHVHRKLLQAGQTLNVELIIDRKLPIPIFFLVIEDCLPDTINWNDTRHNKYKFLQNPDTLKNRRTNKTILFPLFNRKLVYNYEIESIPRGRHHLKNVKLVTGDFLGLVKKEKVFRVDTDVLVQPQDLSINMKNEISFFEEGEQTSYSVKANKTNVVSSVRDYAPGDRVSWVDWKTTAKKQKLITKEFEQEKHKDLTIVLNCVQHRKTDWLAFEAGIELALAMAKISVKEHGRVSLVALGTQREEISLGHNNQYFDQLTRFLSEAKLAEEGSFSTMLLKEGRSVSKDRNLVIVTHRLGKDISKTIHQLNHQDIKVSVVFIRSKFQLTHSERNYLDQLAHQGIVVTWMYEDKLMSKHIEVNA